LLLLIGLSLFWKIVHVHRFRYNKVAILSKLRVLYSLKRLHFADVDFFWLCDCLVLNCHHRVCNSIRRCKTELS
jgi:hypothetical protein